MSKIRKVKYRPLTARQKEVTDLLNELGTHRAVADHLGITRTSVTDVVRSAKYRGWKENIKNPNLKVSGQPSLVVDEDDERNTPSVGDNGLPLTGVSTLYKDGEVVMEWQKTQPEARTWLRFVEELCGRASAVDVKLPKQEWEVGEDICAEICLYDLHFGMYACGDETGDSDYDTDIARKRLLDSVTGFLQRFSYPKTIRLVLGGDQLHADNNTHQTPASGHVLDVDTRHSLVIGKLIAACKDAVDLLAMATEQIEIYVIAGNHDPISSVWLSEVLRAYYDGVDRVSVCDQKTIRKYAKWGSCLSCYGHGDRVKADKWPQLVAAEMPVMWGETRYRYARLGHIHTRKTIAPVVVDEKAGLEVTYLSSLASSDAWHSHSGYVGNQRGMQAFELHKTQGQISQFYCNV